jgi:cytochrome c biogenesis protein
MASKQSLGERLFHKLGSLTTGITLLIVVGLAAAAGTFILQRPLTEPEKMQRAYSPQALYWLDKLGLTDVYHAWWFALLMALLGVAIVFASIDRWPKAWRMVARPYRRPEPHFRAVLPIQRHLAISNASQGLMAAERAFRKAGLRPQRVVENDEVSLFAERNLLSAFSVYVVHASLLLILIGGIVDAFLGYHGYVTLTKGQSTDQVELRTGVMKKLPFTLRCDGAGQENYPDGSPKKWWSKLAVLENGQETLRKEIVVNDPLVTHGVRFYQSGYGSTGQLESVNLGVRAQNGELKQIAFAPDKPVQLDAETSARLARFIPDAVTRDGQIYARSNDPENPAFGLVVTKAGSPEEVWLIPNNSPAVQAPQSGYTFQIRAFEDIKLAAFTGLQVSHEPGQWAVWAGCVLMALGLVMAFYLVHQRYWAVAYEDAKSGGLVLWVGTAADKNREHFQEHFNEIMDDIRKELGDNLPQRSKKASSAVMA